MIRLENIKRDGQYVICDIYPEGSKEPGKLTVNLTDGTGSYTLPDEYEWCESHVNHAVHWIRENAENLPERQLVMWY